MVLFILINNDNLIDISKPALWFFGLYEGHSPPQKAAFISAFAVPSEDKTRGWQMCAIVGLINLFFSSRTEKWALYGLN